MRSFGLASVAVLCGFVLNGCTAETDEAEPAPQPAPVVDPGQIYAAGKKEANRLQQKVNEDEKKEQTVDDSLR